MPIPARLTYVLLCLGLVLAGGLASWLGIEWGTALTGVYDAAIFGVMLWDYRRNWRWRVTITLPELTKLSVGRLNTLKVMVQAGDFPAFIRVRDGYPGDWSATPDVITAAIPPQTGQTLTYTVRPEKRGEVRWQPLAVWQLTPWRLAWDRWCVGTEQRVAVYPDLLTLRELSIRLTLEGSGTLRRKRQLAGGTEFVELRDYCPGDDPRLLDWKATARRGRPLVRVLEPEQEQTVLILLDRGRLMTGRIQGVTRFDWGLNAALALALAVLRRGDRVGLVVFDRQVALSLPAQGGPFYLHRLIEQSARLQPVIQEPDYGGVMRTVLQRQTRRTLVVVLTEVLDTTASRELMRALEHLLPRHLPLCVALRDPVVEQQAQGLALDPTAAYQRAVALDLLYQRQLVLSTLQQQGVLVVDAPAPQVSTPLVDAYLRLKGRGLL
ncbi:MAG: DUF58 domain-containing protein [Gloeomargarita sp. SKYB31]|nr:DUF58 domain-containing protein [Gloeomargarita sp. SKYB31]